MTGNVDTYFVYDVMRNRLEVLASKYSEETNRRTIHFKITGPSHMNLFIDAKETKLTSWCVLAFSYHKAIALDVHLTTLLTTTILTCAGHWETVTAGQLLRLKMHTFSSSAAAPFRQRTTFGSRLSPTSPLMSLLLGTTWRSLPRK